MNLPFMINEAGGVVLPVLCMLIAVSVYAFTASLVSALPDQGEEGELSLAPRHASRLRTLARVGFGGVVLLVLAIFQAFIFRETPAGASAESAGGLLLLVFALLLFFVGQRSHRFIANQRPLDRHGIAIRAALVVPLLCLCHYMLYAAPDAYPDMMRAFQTGGFLLMVLCVFIAASVALFVAVVAYPFRRRAEDEEYSLGPGLARRVYLFILLLCAGVLVMSITLFVLFTLRETPAGDSSWTAAKLGLLTFCALMVHLVRDSRRRIVTQLPLHRRGIGLTTALVVTLACLGIYLIHPALVGYQSALAAAETKQMAKGPEMMTDAHWVAAMGNFGGRIRNAFPDGPYLILYEPLSPTVPEDAKRLAAALGEGAEVVYDRPTLSGEPTHLAENGLLMADQSLRYHPEWFNAAVARHPTAKVVISLVPLPDCQDPYEPDLGDAKRGGKTLVCIDRRHAFAPDLTRRSNANYTLVDLLLVPAKL